MRLVTNHTSRTYLALRAAAERLGGEVRPLSAFTDVDDLARWDPHGALVFLYGWPEAAEESVDLLKGLGIPVAVWQLDDPYYFSDPKLHDLTVRVARRADLYLSHTRQLDGEYAALGVRVRYLPSAAKVFPGVEALVAPPPADEECLRDWAFVGTLTEARRDFLDAVIRQLPEGLVGEAFINVEPLDALRIYRTTRVSLSFSTASEGGARPSEGLTERTWDVPLVGGFLLQDERPYLGEHFELGLEATTFASAGECADRLVHFCRDLIGRRAIAERAQRRVLREHLMEHRLARILDAFRELAGHPMEGSACRI
jgi:spore maturation protein CgeB